jgi:gliding motility-associated-like protein
MTLIFIRVNRIFVYKIQSILILFFLLQCDLKGLSQTDTAFWFAAPEVTYSGGSTVDYDRPIILRITTYQQAAIVTISQPAGGGLPTQVLNIAANATQSLNLTAWIDNIECKPANVVQNKGIKISATAKISAYYDVVTNGNSPEIFVLKGKNAMGNEFYISSQSLLSNSAGYTPLPYSSFNIVASEDNTLVTLKPAKAIVGHAANIPFSIILNKGQTYAAIAASQAAAQHLDGSYVTSDKPIAITLSDDNLFGQTFGGCGDLAGDQTIPTSIIGKEYIAVRGNLNSPYDKVYITPTQNGTTIYKDGVLVATKNIGDTCQLTISNSSSYINTSLPVYAYQLSGIGCEVGSAVLPPINCTGSNSISITRSTPLNLYVTLLVKTGGESNFLVNNVAGVITAAQFSVVPGTSNQWKSAKVTLLVANYPNGSVIKISNTSTLFHMGVLQGDNISGTSFGYFSDFGNIKAGAFTTTPIVCSGAALKFFADTVNSASYSWVGPNGYLSSIQNPTINNALLTNSGLYKLTVTVPGCGTYLDSTIITVKPKATSTISQSICHGQSFLGYNTSGIYNDTLIAVNGCDSIRTLNLTVNSKVFTTLYQSICEGQSFMGHSVTGVYIDTLVSITNCDTIRTLNLTIKPKSFTTITQSICQGQNYLGHSTAGIYVDTLLAANGCDSIRTLNLTVKPKAFATITQSICQGQSFLGHSTAGIYVDTLLAANGCDSMRTLNLTIKPKSFSTITQSICQGQTYLGHSTAGIYVDTLLAVNGCDSIRTLNLTVKPKAFSTITQSICQGQTYLGHSTAGIYVDTLLAANGCDSIRTLNLTVKPKATSTITQSICQGQTYLGHSTAGIYVDTLLAANGCDSIRTLNLTVKPKATSNITQSICQGQTYLGHSTAGIYIDTLLAANGCDSIRTLNLTVKPKATSNITQSICQGQTYLGHSTAGIYVDTLLAANGCDSIRTLNLTIKPKFTSNITKSICEGQIFLGYSTSGVYVDTLLASNGCDSIRTLNLTVVNTPIPSLGPNRNICQGDSLLLNPGTFSQYLWHDGSTQNNYIAKQTGTYSVTVWNGPCAGYDTFSIQQLYPIPTNFLPTTTLVCKGETLSVNGYKSYLWGTGETISTITIKRFDTLTLQVTSFDGCMGIDSAIVKDKGCTVYTIVNAFSPNGDGVNDWFAPKFTQQVTGYRFSIFNRWGSQVFTTSLQNDRWNGKLNSKDLQAGVYYYLLEFKDVDGITYERSGSVTLLR